ncbi:NH(3)-dependent NAD(+) synthetase [Marinitoga hydrogenitolerans DSM 16785]|uniref:Glutamine-dependent NAD(+) synthetase n=2 Tax=Marinitoga TaxID=160798 RepID=A0A1M4Z0I7_MARH1|nr:NAD+ synthase [Marinitoga hydrogenitolerans]SHF11554.1 NH(3)-dependent NAD(+) synthetase [Marinitoga hydrogenitolerans DSM 16785]
MRLRIGIAQLNSHVGNLRGNLDKAKKALNIAETKKSDLLIFPELFLTGYPPEDLVLKTGFLNDSKKILNEYIKYSMNKNVISVIGDLDFEVDAYNAAYIVYNGKEEAKYHKIYLPNYSVFDEKRYFSPGTQPLMIEMKNGLKIGITICEDIWVPNGPAVDLAEMGAHVIVNLSASPYTKGKPESRLEMLKTRASELSTWLVYVNLVGGQDEIVFDGGSVVINPFGEVVHSLSLFEETIDFIDIDPISSTRANLREGKRRHLIYETHNVEVRKIDKSIYKKDNILKGNKKILLLNKYEEMYEALKLGLKDYVYKNGFSKVILGLSGGMDSAFVAALAADVFGGENVFGILMPSQYSSRGSIEDSIMLSKNLGINTHTIPIRKTFETLLKELNVAFKGLAMNVAEENIQARIRGTIVMAFSNKFGYIALATGNKSEVATGYATLYGDMAGGFSPIKDVYKTEIYKLAKYFNGIKGGWVIPENIFTKAPSAELRPDQTDQDKLPPYEILDSILERYIEYEMSIDEIVEDGYDIETVKYVIKLVDLNEYKRRQGAPGIKITQRAFGKDRRMPITNGYKIWR